MTRVASHGPTRHSRAAISGARDDGRGISRRRQGGDGRRVLLVLLSLALVASACGTRVERDRALAMVGGRGEAAAQGMAGRDQVASGRDAASPADAAADGPLAAGGPTGQPVTAGGPTGSAVGANASSAGGTGGSARSGPGATKAPIRIGMDGTWTGIIGQSIAPARDAYQAWAKMINDRGGLNGHPLVLSVSDNGGDAARALSNVQNLVENQHVIALVNLFLPTGADVPVAQYAAKKGIPIVGGFGVDDVWNNSPVMFPAVTTNKWRNFGYAAVTAQSGFKKVGTVYCTEVAVCKATSDGFAAASKQLGMDVVYEGSYSLAQPDFTAQCLQARNAEAEVILIGGDYASGNRMAQSCARQGYKPAFVIPSPSSNVVPEIDGALGSITAFPWFLTSGTPQLEEYGKALARYVSGPAQATSSIGWVNGKLFERAAANLPDVPTSQDVFNGLWSLKNETLGGLSPPLTFAQGQPASENPCWFPVKLSGGKWTAPAGLEPDCRR